MAPPILVTALFFVPTYSIPLQQAAGGGHKCCIDKRKLAFEALWQPYWLFGGKCDTSFEEVEGSDTCHVLHEQLKSIRAATCGPQAWKGLLMGGQPGYDKSDRPLDNAWESRSKRATLLTDEEATPNEQQLPQKNDKFEKGLRELLPESLHKGKVPVPDMEILFPEEMFALLTLPKADLGKTGLCALFGRLGVGCEQYADDCFKAHFEDCLPEFFEKFKHTRSMTERDTLGWKTAKVAECIELVRDPAFGKTRVEALAEQWGPADPCVRPETDHQGYNKTTEIKVDLSWISKCPGEVKRLRVALGLPEKASEAK